MLILQLNENYCLSQRSSSFFFLIRDVFMSTRERHLGRSLRFSSCRLHKDLQCHAALVGSSRDSPLPSTPAALSYLLLIERLVWFQMSLKNLLCTHRSDQCFRTSCLLVGVTQKFIQLGNTTAHRLVLFNQIAKGLSSFCDYGAIDCAYYANFMLE